MGNEYAIEGVRFAASIPLEVRQTLGDIDALTSRIC
jgi:hypothetical protein